MVTEILHRSLKKLQDNQMIRELSIWTGGVEILNLHNADDTLFFCQADLTQAKVIKLTLILFELLTDLKINYYKTFPMYMGRHYSLGQELTAIFNCQQVSFPIPYLGVPLCPYPPTRGDWDKVINRI